MPPPPANFARRAQANRRDAIGALVASVGTCGVFLVMKGMVTSRIDRTPREQVLETRMKRNEKGQPFVQGSDGDWLLVRASAEEAGLLYLRDGIGRVYRLKVIDRVQVDLADDMVVMEIFGDGVWEDQLQQLATKSGNQLLISEREFLTLTESG